MEGSDSTALDTIALLHRLSQLESERDGLRQRVEELSATHASGFGSLDWSLDFVPRFQGRRSTTLEHELEACQQKLNSYKKENAKLQEELSEVYNIKSKFAELLKSEREKNNSLEKEVKFFQTRAAAALSDRDRCILEVEKFQRKEDAMTEEISELEDRLGEVTAELGKVQSMSLEVQTELDKTQEKCEAYEKVVERMWKVREQATGFCATEGFHNRAGVLLHDSEHLWSFGEMNRDLQLQLKQAKEDLEVLQKDLQNCSVSLAVVQAQLEKETLARKDADNAVLHCKEQMSCLTELVNSKLQELRTDKERLKEDVNSFLQEGKVWISSLSESWEYLIDNKVQEKSVISTGEERVVVSHADMQQESDETEDALEKPFYTAVNTEFSKPEVQGPVAVDGTKEETVLGDSEHKGEQNLSKVINVDDQMSIDDNKKALAQALQEKVSALLLLSQQEERHIFEANTTSALESQIAALKQQLLQVTGEKVNALVELARLHEECRKLQGSFKETLQHRRTFSGEQIASIMDNGCTAVDVKHLPSQAFENGKKSSLQGHLKHFWLRGPELGLRSRSLSHMWPSSKSKETETLGLTRLQTENASLRESLSSIRHLCNSANRLRLTIAKVAAESVTQSESSFQAAENAVDGVISEALHLKVALHDSAPANDLGWSSIGSPLARAGVGDVSHDGSDGEANDDLDIVSFFGLEVVRLVLLAAQLQKRCLGQSIQLQL